MQDTCRVKSSRVATSLDWKIRRAQRVRDNDPRSRGGANALCVIRDNVEKYNRNLYRV